MTARARGSEAARQRGSEAAAVHRTEVRVEVGLQLPGSGPAGHVGERRPDNLLDATVVDIYARTEPHGGGRGGDDGSRPSLPRDGALPSSKCHMMGCHVVQCGGGQLHRPNVGEMGEERDHQFSTRLETFFLMDSTATEPLSSISSELRDQDIEAIVDALDVDACIRLACHVPLTSTVPCSSQVDRGLVDAFVSGFRRYAAEVDASAEALWEEERERAQDVVRRFRFETTPAIRKTRRLSGFHDSSHHLTHAVSV